MFLRFDFYRGESSIEFLEWSSMEFLWGGAIDVVEKIILNKYNVVHKVRSHPAVYLILFNTGLTETICLFMPNLLGFIPNANPISSVM